MWGNLTDRTQGQLNDGDNPGFLDRCYGCWASRPSLVFQDSDEMETGMLLGIWRLNPQILFSRAPKSKGPQVAKAPFAAPPKTPPYLHFPPVSGCDATQAADSCRDGGCRSGVAGGVGSARDTPCSR